MATTYTLISSQVLGTSAASVTFSSIPSTYTDLVLKVSARQETNGVTTSGTLGLQFNKTSKDGTVTTYSTTSVETWNTVADSQRYSSSYTPYVLFGVNAGGTTASTFSNVDIYIPNYLASANKPFSNFSVQENNTSTPIYSVAAGAQLWRDTTAISSILLFDAGGYNFATGSSFYLYGVKSS